MHGRPQSPIPIPGIAPLMFIGYCSRHGSWGISSCQQCHPSCQTCQASRLVHFTCFKAPLQNLKPQMLSSLQKCSCDMLTGRRALCSAKGSECFSSRARVKSFSSANLVALTLAGLGNADAHHLLGRKEGVLGKAAGRASPSAAESTPQSEMTGCTCTWPSLRSMCRPLLNGRRAPNARITMYSLEQ